MVTLQHCPEDMFGRFVILESISEQLKYLQLCEVRVYGKGTGCGLPLGLASGQIKAVQISASSEEDSTTLPFFARLYRGGGWCPHYTDKQPYIQVNLISKYNLQGFTTKGLESSAFYVRHLITIKYGFSVEELLSINKTYLVKSSHHLQYFIFPLEITASFVRLMLNSTADRPCLEFELYGCRKIVESIRENNVHGYPAVPLIASPPSERHCYHRLDAFSNLSPITIKEIYYYPFIDSFYLEVWRWQEFNITAQRISVVKVTGNQGYRVVNITLNANEFLGISSPNAICPIIFSQKNTYIDSTEIKEYLLIEDNPSLSLDVFNSSKTNFTILSGVQTFNYRFTINHDNNSGEVTNECSQVEITKPMTFTSPDYPNYYGGRRNCIWNIIKPSDKSLKIDFEAFNLFYKDEEEKFKMGFCQDSVTLYSVINNSTDVVQSANGNAFPLIMTDIAYIRIIFSSCEPFKIVSNSGFKATVSYTNCTGCAIGLMSKINYCQSECGFLASTFYPHNYPSDTNAEWNIQVELYKYIQLQFYHVNMESERPECLQDYVEVYDVSWEGVEKLIGRYCNVKQPPTYLYSSWNRMIIRMKSDQAYSAKRGFFAKYITFESSLSVDSLQKIERNSTLCPGNWIHYEKSCYRYHSQETTMTWIDAESTCQTKKSHLLSIMNEGEMSIIHHLLTTEWRSNNTRTFIGLNDRKNEGQFWWSDGRPMVFTAWANTSITDRSQPDGGSLENCAVIELRNLYSTNQWHDVPCSVSNVKQFICKLDDYSLRREKLDLNLNSSLVNDSSLFKCNNSEFIHIWAVCNGKNDCVDGSDEIGCTLECPSSFYSCGNGECIPFSYQCDQKEDCSNGKDESNCVLKTCDQDEFMCVNGQCIKNTDRCDRIEHCMDGSDESECDFCMQPDMFQCFDGACLPWKTRCDKTHDCAGCSYEDEIGCYGTAISLCSNLGNAVGEGYPSVTCYINQTIDVGRIDIDKAIKISQDDNDTNSIHVDVYYPAFPNNELLVAAMQKSKSCTQTVTIKPCGSVVWSSSYYYSVNNIKIYLESFINKHFDGNGNCEETFQVSNRLFIPILYIYLKTTNVRYNSLEIGKLMCLVDLGHEESEKFICNNLQKVDKRQRCLFEYDEYNIQIGCRDMSHLIDCDNVKPQNTECGKDVVAEEYRGTLNRTNTGKYCQRWDIDYPHAQDVNEPSMVREATVSDAHNFCRNVWRLKSPWCHSLSPDHRREFCDVPVCKEDKSITPMTCPKDYVRCPNFYCIPLRYVCDGVWHCSNGEDEQNCDNYSCPGFYRCKSSRNCIPPYQLCNGKFECPEKDDEEFCQTKCPAHCKCIGLSWFCNIPVDLNGIKEAREFIRQLELPFVDMNTTQKDFYTFPFLTKLNLSHSNIHFLEEYSFTKTPNLFSLDLSWNSIERLSSNTFRGLGRLQELVLTGNRNLRIIDPYSFNGLNSLPNLYLSGLNIEKLPDNSFQGLNSLKVLDLANNRLESIFDNSFFGLSNLQELDLSDNDIGAANSKTFAPLSQLIKLTSDEFRFCCLSPQVDKSNCKPAADAISSCNDLMRENYLRAFLWIFGLSACLGNAFVFIWRFKDMMKTPNSMIITNLAIFDFLMGIYMLIIASVDIYLKGKYIEYDSIWRNHWLCKTSGFLATLSSEGSVCTLALMTLDRVINIVNPLSTKKLTTKSTIVTLFGVWLFVFIISILPLFPIDYFGSNFYGRSGVCVSLPLTADRPAGWQYSAAIFLGFNFVCFVIIAAGYFYMYRIINSSSSSLGSSQRRNQIAVARKIMLIILTDFVCWLPIIIIGFVAVTGTEISGDVYAFVIVFVLPINSALNPLLYTISSIRAPKKKMRKTKNSTGPNSVTRITTYDNEKHKTSMIVFYGGDGKQLTLKQVASLRQTKVAGLLIIAIKLFKIINGLHNIGLVHGNFKMSNTAIRKNKKIYQVGILGLENAQHIQNEFDTSEDIYGLSIALRSALQTFNK
ncbi:DgyrCDS11838 [Dimorphilus gyrociliatus]|uniref:DgyrCDS11838 n=1 Tax=Dimorphilus gyrociliatus TaxID=2664684 RepID=A0A7I8W4L9_9ANNE|nr:DgyrCDS11838 [Dimorphilus gyrociliatus]